MKKNDKINPNKEVISEAVPYLVIILVVIIIRTFIATPIKVNGPSMETTLYDGYLMILNKLGAKVNGLKRFDIVVVKAHKERIIKRVIGLPGETLKYENGILYINDKMIEENYLDEVTKDFTYEGKIPDECYFVMGDNRDDSLDSRYFGCFPKKDILGHASFVLFPFAKFGKL